MRLRAKLQLRGGWLLTSEGTERSFADNRVPKLELGYEEMAKPQVPELSGLRLILPIPDIIRRSRQLIDSR